MIRMYKVLFMLVLCLFIIGYVYYFGYFFYGGVYFGFCVVYFMFKFI